ncbi:PoNe immunity protein domain-containing protein [Snodgrassella communis]|uniref:PoNe immunity protein domain-containing protein n=1 Tax=Snodgrassella communis TaxID=2946699 RepID=UPI001EF55FB2|nr:PoNe immunity protein domain-containing protein [Snodgrassella communis]
MRTHLKTQDYFNTYFELQTDDLNYYENSLKEGTVKENRIPAVKRKIFIITLHTLIAKYTSGYAIEELRKEFPLVINRFVEGWNANDSTPEDDVHFDEYLLMLRMLSLGVLLETGQDNFNKIIEVLHKSNRKDDLFSFIISYKTGYPSMVNKLTYEQFRPLCETTKEMDKNKAITILKNYLEKDWYKSMKLTYWYDNHKSKADTFFGYWSFESGALAKILGLDDTALKDQPYYPYDMVHWKE